MFAKQFAPQGCFRQSVRTQFLIPDICLDCLYVKTYGIVLRPMNALIDFTRLCAAGFFVAGSSIKDMNGCYQRVRNVHRHIEHTVIAAYRKWRWGEDDDLTGWHITLVEKPQVDT